MKFCKTCISGKINFSSLGLKQWNNGKAITEKYSPFLVVLQKEKYFSLDIIKASIS